MTVAQAAQEGFKVAGDGLFFAGVHVGIQHLRLAVHAALAVIQKYQRAAGLDGVADGYADAVFMPPAFGEIAAAEAPAQGIGRFAADAENVGDLNKIAKLVRVGADGKPAAIDQTTVVLLHQLDIAGGQLVAQLLLHVADDAVVGRGAASAVGGSGTVDIEDLWAAARTVFDPEIPVNIVDLGLVYRLEIVDGGNVEVDMTLTAPGCSMGPMIADDLRVRLESVSGVRQATVNIVWDPPWNQDMMSQEARMILGLA